MRARLLPGGFLVAMVLVAVLFGAPATAPAVAADPGSTITISIHDPTAQVDRLLRDGHELELQRRWSEAVVHYEDAMRRYPADPSLRRRFEYARMHYDLSRRYLDRSFRDAVLRLSASEALDLYAQVLLKIQSHYVETPQWKDVVERGTEGFEVALGEADFLASHAPSRNRASIDALRGELRRVLGPRVVASRQDATAAVATAARLAEQRLGIRPTAVVLEYLCGATNSLDPYSAFLTPDQLHEVYAQIDGNFVGLGIELKSQDGSLLIVRVIPGSPADQGGIRTGDRIVAVDGHSTRGLSTDEAANLLQGEEGNLVELSLADSGTAGARRLVLRRRRVEVPSVERAEIVDAEAGVALCRVSCFQKTTARDLESALWRLHRDGMRSLVVDLRGNPGGLLLAAVEAADLFLDRGIIVATRGRNTQEDFTYTAHENGTWQVPLVVLIDGDSASAAEIFAGAIRDHRRGTIVGARSYGKGSVQGIFPIDGSPAGVRLTTAKFYSPNGQPYSGVGVEPDWKVQQTARPIDGHSPPGPDDAILTAGLQAARQLVLGPGAAEPQLSRADARGTAARRAP